MSALGESTPRSAPSGVVWPAIPGPRDALVQSLLYQLEDTQWWPPDRLLAMQLRQAHELVRHAQRSAPYWRDRLAETAALPTGRLTWERFASLPILTRAEFQAAGEAIYAASLPPGQSRAFAVSTSGSTGRPIEARWTEAAKLMDDALILRDAAWRGRNPQGKLCAVFSLSEEAKSAADRRKHWLPGFDTGPASYIDARRPLDELLAWIDAERPDYVLAYPTQIAVWARMCLDRGRGIPSLKEFAAYSEQVEPWHREICREAFGVEIADIYMCQEFGKLATECRRGGLHVMAENAIVEVLDDAGRACLPGETGRVVVTGLVNLATPLIRYEIGDLAEPGGTCACGRGLATLARIAGRKRNQAILPDGRRVVPPTSPIVKAFLRGSVRQFRMIQRSLDEVELQLVSDRPLTDDERDRVRAGVRAAFDHPFPIRIVYVDAIPRGPGGKFEEFRCEIEPPP